MDFCNACGFYYISPMIKFNLLGINERLYMYSNNYYKKSFFLPASFYLLCCFRIISKNRLAEVNILCKPRSLIHMKQVHDAKLVRSGETACSFHSHSI